MSICSSEMSNNRSKGQLKKAASIRSIASAKSSEHQIMDEAANDEDDADETELGISYRNRRRRMDKMRNHQRKLAAAKNDGVDWTDLGDKIEDWFEVAKTPGKHWIHEH